MVFLKKQIYKYDSYKGYLSDIITANSKSLKGYRGEFCKYVGCHSSYLPQVLNGEPHFNLEQADRINNLLSHNKLESRYFILLVQKARAGSKSLELFFKDQLEELKSQSLLLKNQLKEAQDIPEKAHHTYYSTWYYAAIHVMLSIPEYSDNPFKISERLNLPLEIVNKVITFLLEIGLVEKKSKGYILVDKSFHLSSHSEFVQRHHVNWRSQSLLSAEKNIESDFHYSNITAISKDDFYKIKETLFESVKKCRKIIKPSKEETMVVIAMDLFEI